MRTNCLVFLFVFGPVFAAAAKGPVPPPSTYVVTVSDIKIKTHKRSGKPWDWGGGKPDPSIQIWVNGRPYTQFPTLLEKDQLRPKPFSTLPLELKPTDTIQVELTDQDAASDDPIGRSKAVALESLAWAGTKAFLEMNADPREDGLEDDGVEIVLASKEFPDAKDWKEYWNSPARARHYVLHGPLGKTKAHAMAWLADYEDKNEALKKSNPRWPRGTALLAGGYPKVVRSDKVDGLAPGKYVVVLGVCSGDKEPEFRTALARLQALDPAIQGQEVPGERHDACPFAGEDAAH